MQDVLEQLEKLVVADPEFLELENRLGRFCLFEAMGVVHGEVRLGNFMAAFLDPAGSHGYGPTVLRALVMEALRAGQARDVNTASLSPLHAHVMSFEQAQIVREFRRIDIVVKLGQPKIAIAIELKIGASQSAGQLARYRQVMEQEFPDWRRLYIFLTVEDEDPADQAWIPLRYSQIVPVFEKVDGSGADSAATGAFRAFIDMLKRHHVSDDKLEEIANNLWARHKEALNFLMERRPDRLRGIFQSLAAETRQITEEINRSGTLQFINEPSKNSAILRFACSTWDILPRFSSGTGWTESGRVLLFEMKKEKESINGYLYLGPCPTDIKIAISDALWPGQRVLKSQYIQIEKAVLYSEEDGEIVEVINKITKHFAEFCQKTAVKFSPLLKAALEKRIIGDVAPPLPTGPNGVLADSGSGG